MGLLFLLYGIASYAVFFATFLYAVGFVANAVVPKSIDVGLPFGAAGEPLWLSLAINAALLGVFAVQHSVMARPAFKRWFTRIVPHAIERSTFVLLASAALVLVFAQWRPLVEPVWLVDGPLATALTIGALVGWGIVLVSTFMLDHFELFGLKQVFNAARKHAPGSPEFRTPLLYRHVRHPIYLGFLIAFWCTPAMTLGHLLFAVGTTGYIFIGIWFEERDLVAQFGRRYRDYRNQVGMLLPRLRRTAAAQGRDELQGLK